MGPFKQRLSRLVDSLDWIVYGVLVLLGFGGLAYVAYVSFTG
jgi:hypothetical protein